MENLTRHVLQLVAAERRKQDERYGRNLETPDGTGPETRWLLPYTSDSALAVENRLREDYEDFEEESPVTWVHLLREELAEAFCESDRERLVEEVTQVAALAVKWLEAILVREDRELLSKLNVYGKPEFIEP